MKNEESKTINLDGYNIAIFTRSMNWYLFKMLKATLQLPFAHHRIIGASAEGYLYKILQHDIDYAINIDEDAFVVDNAAILDLLRHCIRENIVSCGMRDGGMVPIRTWNPLVINPFFSIMNVAEIRKRFSYEAIAPYYLGAKQGVVIAYEKLVPANLPCAYRTDLQYEPFYPFYLWLNTNFKTEYLTAETHADGVTTVLKNHLGGGGMLHHTWYSRDFGKDEFHTRRILNVFNACKPKDFRFTFFDRTKASIDFLIVKIAKFLEIEKWKRRILGKIKRSNLWKRFHGM